MERILVSGGAGFIGYNLCKKLLLDGDKIVAVDNLITSTGNNIKLLSKFKQFHFIRHNIVKPFTKTVLRKLGRITKIYHLACPTGVDNIKRLGEEMLLTCSLGTRNVLELAKLYKIPLLFTSSSEVYGDPLVFPQKESYTGNVDTLGYRSPYEEGKRFSESLITTYMNKYHISAKIVRVFNTYGPGMSESDSRVVPRFLKLARLNKPLTVLETGLQKRTFCYIDDLISALVMVMKKGEKGEVYNVGSKTEIKINELAQLIVNLTRSKSKIVYRKPTITDHARRLPDLGKINKLGWKPTTKLEDGLQKTLKWSGY